MNLGVYEWSRAMRTRWGLGGSIVEVGSRNINGSVRGLFEERAEGYVGVDLFAGEYVDVVADAMEWEPPGVVDGVVCTEVLEHVRDPQGLVTRMAGWLRPGGWMLITTRSPGFPRHEYPHDYWRFRPHDLRNIFERAGLAVLDEAIDPTPDQPGVFAIGRTPVLFAVAEP